MRTITIRLPNSLDVTNEYLIILLAIKLFEQGKITLTEAREMAGMDSKTFAAYLKKVGISIRNVPLGDFVGK